jgi:hypothetical protein
MSAELLEDVLSYSLLDEQEWGGDEETSETTQQRVSSSNAEMREHGSGEQRECSSKG